MRDRWDRCSRDRLGIIPERGDPPWGLLFTRRVCAMPELSCDWLKLVKESRELSRELTEHRRRVRGRFWR
jgi:hypothetical protein